MHTNKARGNNKKKCRITIVGNKTWGAGRMPGSTQIRGRLRWPNQFDMKLVEMVHIKVCSLTTKHELEFRAHNLLNIYVSSNSSHGNVNTHTHTHSHTHTHTQVSKQGLNVNQLSRLACNVVIFLGSINRFCLPKSTK